MFSFETQHQGSIVSDLLSCNHSVFFIKTDSSFDFFGGRLATADSNGVVQVSVVDENQVEPQSVSMVVDVDNGL